MAIFTPIAVDGIPVPPSLVVLLLLTSVVLAIVYAYQPPLPQTIAFAFVPWVVTGSLLSVLASDAQYPSYLAPLFTAPAAFLTMLLVPGLAWVTILNVSVSRRQQPPFHHYIGMMGVGAMLVLWSVLVLQVGAAQPTRLLILIVVPLVALLATGLISITIGFWSPDFVDYATITGGFAIFGALVNGIATTTNVAVLGASGHTYFSASVRDIVLVLVPQGVAGYDVTHLWVTVFLLANLAIGIHVATRLPPYADTSPRAVNVMLGIVGLVGFTLGFNRLLQLVVG